MTMPYNLCGNSICGRFNHTLLGLLQTLPKEQKSCWPLHVPSLVLTYNAMPHSITGYQPYDIITVWMFLILFILYIYDTRSGFSMNRINLISTQAFAMSSILASSGVRESVLPNDKLELCWKIYSLFNLINIMVL